MMMATMTTIITTTPAIIMGGDTRERRARGVSWSPRSTKARNRPVLALGSCSNSDMWTTLAGQRVARCRIRCNFRAVLIAGGQRVGPVDQPGQDDHALGPDHEGFGPDPLHDVLEVPDVGGPDVNQGVRLPGDRARVHHLGVAADRHADLLGRGPAAAVQLHVRLG